MCSREEARWSAKAGRRLPRHILAAPDVGVDARREIEASGRDYNHFRPHSSLRNIPERSNLRLRPCAMYPAVGADESVSRRVREAAVVGPFLPDGGDPPVVKSVRRKHQRLLG